PKVIKSWEEELDDLIRFYDYPTVIQRQIYTTNTIERAIKDVKKRLKPMNSLPSESAVEKIIYLLSVEYNEKWAQRKISEFSSAQTELKRDRKSTRLNSSHVSISYAVFCLKKK